jgi:hypothetical protein
MLKQLDFNGNWLIDDRPTPRWWGALSIEITRHDFSAWGTVRECAWLGIFIVSVGRYHITATWPVRVQ